MKSLCLFNQEFTVDCRVMARFGEDWRNHPYLKFWILPFDSSFERISQESLFIQMECLSLYCWNILLPNRMWIDAFHRWPKGETMRSFL